MGRRLNNKQKLMLFFMLFATLLSNLQRAQGSEVPSFNQHTPTPQVIDGEAYPRANGEFLYRGTGNSKMSVEKYLWITFGFEAFNLESEFFENVKKALMKKKTGKYYAVINDYTVQRKIDNYRRDVGRLSDEGKASIVAKEIVDEYFNSTSESTLVARYINYRSGSHIPWPTKVLYTSFIPNIAAKYGGKVVVIKEQTPRSIDLGFYNLVHNNVRYEAKRDAGEFVAPGYIPGSDVVGLEIRKVSGVSLKPSKNPDTPSWFRRVQKDYQNLDYALYKEEFNGKPYVLVLDGEKEGFAAGEATCFWRVSKTKYVECIPYLSGDRRDRKPKLTGTRAKLIGVITLCSDSESCSMPSEIRNAFPRSSRGIPKKLKKVFKPGKERITFPNGQKAKFLL